MTDTPLVRSPVQTVQEFVTLAGFLEDGAAAAYLGYSDKIPSKQLLTQAGAIVSTEYVSSNTSASVRPDGNFI